MKHMLPRYREFVRATLARPDASVEEVNRATALDECIEWIDGVLPMVTLLDDAGVGPNQLKRILEEAEHLEEILEDNRIHTLDQLQRVLGDVQTAKAALGTVPAPTPLPAAVRAAAQASDAFNAMFASTPPWPTAPRHPYDRNFEV